MKIESEIQRIFEESMICPDLSRPSSIVSSLEELIQVEKLNLEANTILQNDDECLTIKHRIADVKILLLRIRRNL